MNEPTNHLMVQTAALTKRYGDRTAVDGVSMSVRRGEVYGFLGPNGAGKTTTLRMMLGLVRPTSGSVTVLGGPAGRPDVVERVGALVEGPGFYPYLSGRENLRVLARYRALPDAVVEEALTRVDLAQRGDDRFKGYSLGMKQRLGVAAALMGEPELIVLDEPTNGLDPAGMADMRELIVSLARGGQTVLLSSHLLAEVQEICDRVGVISDGRLLRESTVAELRGSTTLRVRATPLDRALAVAMRLAGDEGVHIADAPAHPPDPADPADPADPLDAAGGVLALDLPASAAPEVVRALVDDHVDVHEVSAGERSLEEVFFELTTSASTSKEEVR